MKMRLAVLVGMVGFMAPMLAGQTVQQTLQVSRDNKTISVTATDTAEALADTAEVSVGFVVYGASEDQTYADASRISNRVMKALEDSGVKSDQIQSGSQNLSPVDPNDKQRYGAGIRFVFRQSWQVKVQASSAAEVLHLAVTNGANESGGIAWSLAAEGSLEAQAAEKALAHAKQIAERMAAGLHVTLGPLVYASNQAGMRPGPVMMAMANAPRMLKEAKPEVKPLAISPGKVSRSATVYAVFALE
ncbi:SIMPL domain-containing protein [Granulicella sp. WH15]|uniref:SIMPL domain-containing protein n=1 Tax=Granulicella sp. WH15 TaxID=2602070 RepID=UPI0013A5B2C6|nr:SIMPL domain-containing protein [Granulicella sp. WH15]